MKFPSLFRVPKHGRFHYEPRYYDPIKEEIQAKIEAAKKNQSEKPSYYDASSISEAFKKRERKSSHASGIQLILAVVLLGTFLGWMYYGNKFFYVFLLLAPVYFYFRVRGFAKKKD